MPTGSKPRPAPRRPTRALGERLRAARERKGLSIQAVVAEARISTGYLSKLENGVVATPSPRVLQRLADVLGVRYASLMELAGYLASTQTAELAAEPAVDRVSPHDGATNERILRVLDDLRQELRHLREGQERLRRLVARTEAASGDG
jgi:transcriptional regulator with XRE-family HTH domain